MTLSDYRSREGLTLAALGARLGLPISTVHAYLTGARRPTPAQCLRIVAATDGLIGAADLRPDLAVLMGKVSPGGATDGIDDADAVQHANDQAPLRGEAPPPVRHPALEAA